MGLVVILLLLVGSGQKRIKETKTGSSKALEDINVSLIDVLATINLNNNYVKYFLHFFSNSVHGTPNPCSHVYMSFKELTTSGEISKQVFYIFMSLIRSWKQVCLPNIHWWQNLCYVSTFYKYAMCNKYISVDK